MMWEGVPVFPGFGGDFGNAVVGEHARRWFGGDYRGGTVVSLMDVWVLDPRRMSALDWMPWTPIDHDPVPPAVVDVLARSDAIPMAMSRFGEERLREAGLDPVYSPHAIDTNVLKPLDRTEARRALASAHLPPGQTFTDDMFLIGMVAANKGRPSRKGFQQLFEAFAELAAQHENVALWLHTTLDPDFASGENLMELGRLLNLPFAERWFATDQYKVGLDPYSPSQMATLYNAFDVLVNPAAGEGFGVPILEAQSCGTPVIVTDFSSMSEICGAGWKVACPARIFTGQNSWQRVADVGDLYDAMRQAYCMSPTQRASLKQRARAFALNYSLPKVAEEHFIPALKTARERFEERAPVELAVAA